MSVDSYAVAGFAKFARLIDGAERVAARQTAWHDFLRMTESEIPLFLRFERLFKQVWQRVPKIIGTDPDRVLAE